MFICRVLTILFLIYGVLFAEKTDLPTDPPESLASYDDSEDPDDLDLSSTPLKSSNPSAVGDNNDDDTNISPSTTATGDDPSNDDFYVETEESVNLEPEYDEEEEEVEEDIDEDREKGILKWVKDSVGADIFEDISMNVDLLSELPTEYSIVYPVQIRKNQILGLDTHDTDKTKPGVHFHRAHINVLFTDYRIKYRLKLTLNRELMNRDLKQKRNIDESTQIIEESDAENCYYQGEVKKSSGSKVIISTCSGLSGIIIYNGKIQVIMPLAPVQPGNETRWPHVLYEIPQTERRHVSANGRGMWQSFRQLHVGEYMRRRKIMMAMKNDFDVMAEKKRLQLGLVADNNLVTRYNGSRERIQAHMLQVANIMDAVLKEVNIHISVKFLEIWNHDDQIAMDTNARALLHHFLKYRTDTMSYIGIDVAHLLTAQSLRSGEVGMAIPDSICSSRAVAVSQDFGEYAILRTTSGALHMLGHMLGIAEQSENGCLCPQEGGCLMDVTANGSISHQALQFSACARTSLEESLLGGLGSCLLEDPPRDVFPQTCGNGRVERGEECDCLSVQECRLKDPCCNPKTCLLQPWATCRFGDCCDNCTVLPPTYMCRLALTECDVPEFCDGSGGYCPDNQIVQTGWPCEDHEGFCYKGLCQTYRGQCQLIWGQDAEPADAKCYETFNTAGRFDGHCGPNITSGEYVRCDDSDVGCGLLHCTGGDEEPRVAKDKTFSSTTVNSGGNNYQCKILSSHHTHLFPSLGLVQDGTRCTNHSICVNRRCVPIDALVTGTCPLGANGETCSGRGVCTNTAECFCYSNFTGTDCSIYRKQTTFLPPAIITPISIQEQTTSTVRINVTKVTQVMSTTTLEPPIMEKERSVSTLWLIIVLSSVAGGTLLLLGCCMLCYRRKSPMDFATKKKKKKKNQTIFGSITSFSSSNSKGSKSREDSGDEVASSRIISFGNMPSYRADKLKKVMRKSLGGISEQSEGSEPSQGDRDSTEVKVVQTLPLARAPEKGILKKKYPRSSDDLLSGGSSVEMMPLRRVGINPPPVPRAGGESEAMLARPEEEDEDIECGSCCSCDSFDKKSDCSLNEDDCCTDARDQQTQTDPESSQNGSPTEMARDLSSDSLEGAKNKIIKLKNINELLKQIDEQFNSVLRQTTQGDMSPGGSDEMRGGSETEADRHFPRNSFYKQSDIEEGYSPPHRSPILSPNRHSSGAQYSPDPLPSPSAVTSSPLPKVSSGTSPPEPLKSPSGIISPITAQSPVGLSSPLSVPSSMYRDPLRGPRHTTSTPILPKSLLTSAGPSVSSQPEPPPRPPREQSPVPPPRNTASPKASPKPQPRQRHGSKGSNSSTPPRGSPTPQPRKKHPTSGTVSTDCLPPKESLPSKDTTQTPLSPQSQPSPPRKVSPPFGGLWSQKRQSPPKETSKPASPKSSPKNQNHSNNKCVTEQPVVTAVPYRGAKSSVPGSPTLGTRHKSPTPSTSSDSKKHKLASPKSPGSSFLSKLAQGLDSNPFKRRGSHNTDSGDGYGSDHGSDDAIIIREIPARKPVELPFMPNPNGAYTKAPGSPGSPEDINV